MNLLTQMRGVRGCADLIVVQAGSPPLYDYCERGSTIRRASQAASVTARPFFPEYADLWPDAASTHCISHPINRQDICAGAHLHVVLRCSRVNVGESLHHNAFQ